MICSSHMICKLQASLVALKHCYPDIGYALQASRLSQGASLLHDAPAAPEAAAAASKEAALAVNQALDAEPPTLCLQLDSATQPELLPLQDPTPMVGHPDTIQRSL